METSNAFTHSETLKIVTNNHPREIVRWYELTDAERADLDYRDTEASQDDFSGFRYCGSVYDLGEFMVTDIEGWHGIQTDSYFSGVLVRYTEDFEWVVVARCFC